MGAFARRFAEPEDLGGALMGGAFEYLRLPDRPVAGAHLRILQVGDAALQQALLAPAGMEFTIRCADRQNSAAVALPLSRLETRAKPRSRPLRRRDDVTTLTRAAAGAERHGAGGASASPGAGDEEPPDLAPSGAACPPAPCTASRLTSRHVRPASVRDVRATSAARQGRTHPADSLNSPVAS